jgi:hypothetical protein
MNKNKAVKRKQNQKSVAQPEALPRLFQLALLLQIFMQKGLRSLKDRTKKVRIFYSILLCFFFCPFSFYSLTDAATF